jgi:hypothetical protein
MRCLAMLTLLLPTVGVIALVPPHQVSLCILDLMSNYYFAFWSELLQNIPFFSQYKLTCYTYPLSSSFGIALKE